MKLMELKELIDELVESIGEENAENIDVKFAHQPAWPMEYSLDSDIVVSDDGLSIYLIENQQLGYLDSDITNKLGW